MVRPEVRVVVWAEVRVAAVVVEGVAHAVVVH
jgi:hypothetical protein